jgi:hypothetical protein
MDTRCQLHKRFYGLNLHPVENKLLHFENTIEACMQWMAQLIIARVVSYTHKMFKSWRPGINSINILYVQLTSK